MPEAQTNPEVQTKTSFTIRDFHEKLSERVSGFDADLILNRALLDAELPLAKDTKIDREKVRTICLQLIKQGGPAFQVGQIFYNQV